MHSTIGCRHNPQCAGKEMKYTKSILFGLLGIVAFSNVNSAPISQIATVTQQLVAPPFLPEHSQIDNSSPKNIQVRMTIEEKVMEISKGLKFPVSTYNGTIPGPVIVVHTR